MANKKKARGKHPWQSIPEKGRIFKGESKTIPGESFTIKELIKRQAGGIIDQRQQEEYYDDNPSHESPDLEKVSQMDLTEVQELKKDTINTELEKAVEEKEKQKSKATETKETEQNEEPEVEEAKKDTSTISEKNK